MNNVRFDFNIFDGNVNDLKGYQCVECHIIFDIKIGENFQSKARMVAGGHMTLSTSSMVK